MTEPVTLEEAKAHLRVEDDSEDDLINAMIAAARQHVEGVSGHLLTARAVEEYRPGFSSYFELYSWPVRSIASVTYLDQDGVTTTLATGDYAFSPARPARLYRSPSASWPSVPIRGDAVKITVNAGYATPADVPPALKQAVLLALGHFYTNRSAGSDRVVNEVPMAVDALCRPFRLIGV